MPSPTTHPHELMRLPYAEAALAPVISASTIGHHYGKHHKTYVDTLNKLVADTDLAGMSLQDTIAATKGQFDKRKIYSSAAQVWNHDFYWRSLKPGGGGKPPQALMPMIDASFGSAQACTERLASAAGEHFGSGWVWLVQEGSRLVVSHTDNADGPHPPAGHPLLVIDLWEHAYYLDYQEKRAAHVEAVLDKLINWGFAADNLARSG